MAAQNFDVQATRIAELLDNIEKANTLIVMHQEHTKDQSMIKQYQYHRNTFLQELKQLMQPYHLSVQLEEA
jgi:hypothetical protein